MKKLKRFLCFFIPCILVIAITLGIVLPLTFNGAERTQISSFESVLADETGASTADKSKKGGAIYIEQNTNYYMAGGTISGSKNTYGGAVFVASGATFTMEGGTITGCSAKYGGAIYVASGGTCTINGGKILDNTAEVAPAIYVEEGGRLTIVGDPEISKNTFGKFIPYALGPNTVLGAVTNQTILKTILFGTYPKTYVGDSMNSTLESWYSGKQIVKTYTCRRSTWSAYLYTDGNMYARGSALAANSNSVYKDGTKAVAGKYTWFKVEPITWFILNYDEWMSGSEDLELYSELVIAGDIYFNASASDGNNWETSYIRNWCNSTFFNEAFDESEQELIKDSVIGNNVTGDYANADSDTKGNSTTDKIYLKSYYEMTQAPFSDSNSRIAANSDFALGNNGYNFIEDESFATAHRSDRSSYYWLRSAGGLADFACYVDGYGDLYDDSSAHNDYYGVRPALHLDL